MTKWISVSENLPKAGRWVLVYKPNDCSHDNKSPIQYFVKIKYVNKNVNPLKEKTTWHGVTHWAEVNPPENES